LAVGISTFVVFVEHVVDLGVVAVVAAVVAAASALYEQNCGEQC
jgi:hypothetical protein